MLVGLVCGGGAGAVEGCWVGGTVLVGFLSGGISTVGVVGLGCEGLLSSSAGGV